jgi:hypothetical protein
MDLLKLTSIQNPAFLQISYKNSQLGKEILDLKGGAILLLM